MSTNNIKSKAVRLGALVLASGAALLATGCNQKDKYKDLFFTVKRGSLEITFCDRGASIYSMNFIKKDSTKHCVTYQPQDKNIFVEQSYYGKCLGRIAGRIPDGQMTVGYKDYQLEINETARGKNNTLHGGTNGMSTKDWTHTIKEKKDYTEVAFKYLSPALEAGFPEALNAKYTFKIYDDGKLDLIIDAGSSGVTPVDLSYHPYFRLGTSEGDTVLNHTLFVPADNMAKYDSDGQQTVEGYIPVDNLKPEGKETTPFDFREETPGKIKTIGQDIDDAKSIDGASGGYDHIWYFGANKDVKSEETKKDPVHVELTNPDTNIKLEVVSPDSDGVIMYANCYPVAGQKMNDGENDEYGKAITIEPYTFFTTDNESFSKLYIDEGKPFSRHITYQFTDTTPSK